MSELKELDKVPSEEVSKKARELVDDLRSVQLYAKLKALEQTVEALKASLEDVNRMATDLAGIYLQKYSITRKIKRTMKLSKWAWITLITIIIIAGLYFILR